MLEELNEIIKTMIIDIASEGIGTTAGIALMWTLFLGGTLATFYGIIFILSSTI